MQAFHLTISGRVQGVGYRAWMAATARSLGVHGWVRNRSDGTVEALAHGKSEQVQLLIAACKEGPPAARVDKVELAPSNEAIAEGFIQKPTA